LSTVLVAGRKDSIADYTIEFAWGARAETIEGCAARWLAMLRAVGRCDPGFARWYDVMSGPPEEVRLELGALVELVRAHPLELYEDEERYSVTLENQGDARDYDYVIVSAGSGCAPGLGGNGGFISLRGLEEAAGHPVAPPSLRCILEATIDAWRPAWGVAKPTLLRHAHLGGMDAAWRKHVEAGWLTYLAVPPTRLPPLPVGAEAVPFADGVLIVAVPGPFRADDAEHVAAVDRIQSLLEEAGLAVVQL
jgi:hypothetical protein